MSAKLAAAAVACLAALPSAAAATPHVDFHGVIDGVMAVYVPRLAADGIALSFVEKHDGLIVGWGDRPDLTHAVLGFDSGYYADEKVTAEGFRFAACHEMGHIMGSEPHRPAPPEYDGPLDRNGDLLISAEGQADYYAAAMCLRLVLVREDSIAFVRAHPAPPRAAAECAKRYPEPEASALCQRVAMAGQNFLDSLAIVVPTSFETPAREVADKTLTGEYPTRQCRLDTILAGALERGRPPCWFKE